MQNITNDCYALDEHCYSEFHLTKDILMEHAAQGMSNFISANFALGSSVLILCGAGNNGADGIALARQLYGNYDIRLYLVNEPKSDMCKLQLERAKKVGIAPVTDVDDADVIVDAIWGTGLNRALTQTTKQLLDRLNRLKGYKIACDVPTGTNLNAYTPCFIADTTITMGARKTHLYLDAYKQAVGNIVCIDLGVSSEVYIPTSNIKVLEASDLNPPTRTQADAHKGTFGHASIFMGEKCGASIIAGEACTRYGAGLTTLIYQETNATLPPHLMSSRKLPTNTTALAIGMGLGNHFSQTFLQTHVIDSTLPILLDADAFSNPTLLNILEQKERHTIITPHPKEFSLLWQHLTSEKLSIEHIQTHRFEVVQNFSQRYPHVVLLLKGANMLISKGEALYINPLGTVALSKGGSGDVLAGLITALLAQGYEALEATIQGSLALTLASSKFEGANYSLLPHDIIENIIYT